MLEIQQGTPLDFHPALAKAASRGLHDTAQPLTVLQGLLELTLMQAETVDEYRESFTAALAEMARLTACFENLRQLMRLQQPAPDVCDFSISGALCAAVDGVRALGQEVVFDLPANSDQDVVHASQGRVRQTLTLLISGAALHSQDGIRISIESQDQAVSVRVMVARLGESLASSLEMARLVAASAGGEIRFIEIPVSVLLVLPIAAEHPSTDKKGKLNHV